MMGTLWIRNEIIAFASAQLQWLNVRCVIQMPVPVLAPAPYATYQISTFPHECSPLLLLRAPHSSATGIVSVSR